MSKSDPSVLLAVTQQLKDIPFEYLFVPHCIIVASWFPQLRNRFLFSYWVGFLAAAGGGTISSLLLMDSKRAPVALFAENKVGVIWTVSWWLVNFFPYQLVRKIAVLLPVRVVLKVCLNSLRASLVAARTQLAADLYPGVFAAPLVLGTIAGSGGKFCIDILTGATGELKGPSEFTVPGFAVRSGFAGALLYYLSVTQWHWLSPDEGRGLIVLLYVIHGLISDIAGRPLDFTLPIARLVAVAQGLTAVMLEIA
ncbi:hypothetical protein WJX73_009380 [Symbiochloris irregularis]|uniref:Uncharacterized protein n=1 Tax=Symbiochloris irregularis TaxID=706552 RepID=A0AAW1PEA6_9CHLO